MNPASWSGQEPLGVALDGSANWGYLLCAITSAISLLAPRHTSKSYIYNSQHRPIIREVYKLVQ